MGTPDFAVPALVALDSEGHDIVLAISQQDKPKGRGNKVQSTPVKEKALELGIKVHQPEFVNDKETIDLLKVLAPDFIVVAAYGQILTEEILSIPKFECLNIHASLLPKYRGAAPINWAIINGESETGVTIIKMVRGLDSGPMILKRKISISSDETSISLNNKLAELGSKLIVDAIYAILTETAEYEEQDKSDSSYAPMLYKDSGRIFWEKSAADIHNLVRALVPWPSAFMEYKDTRVKIHQTEIELAEHSYIPGTIVSINQKGIKVAASDGYVIIKELQFPNKKSMPVSAYLLGNSIQEGYIL
jgi:methionyl-tRNA formyltransferase